MTTGALPASTNLGHGALSRVLVGSSAVTDTANVAAVVAAWTRAVAAREEPAAVIRPVLADGVKGALVSGAAETADEVAAAISSPQLVQVLGGTAWSEPVVDGDRVRTKVALAPGGVIGGMEVVFQVGDDGLVVTVEQSMTPATPPEEQAVSLTGTVAEAIDDALAKGVPMIVAYVDPDGQPSLSLRGSVKVHSDTEVQLWVRSPDGGLAGALAGNDHLSFWYRNGEQRSMLQLKGRGRVVTDAAERQAVYDSTVEPERRADRDCRGVAVIATIDKVEGRLPGGAIRMVRNP